MSSDAPVDVLLCDKCSQKIPPEDFRQCRICGGYYHGECYRLHRDGIWVMPKPPLHEWREARK